MSLATLRTSRIGRTMALGALASTMALSILGGATAASAAAPRPEVAVSATTGIGERAFIVRNEGNTTIPAGTKFRFKSNQALSVGLFGDAQLNQQWNVGLAGSGNEADVRLNKPLLPGQELKLRLATVSVEALTQYMFELDDPNTAAIDTNYYNNKAKIVCIVSVVGLGACTASSDS